MEEEEGVIAGMTECLATVEENVETFVPDPFNRRTRYCMLKSRQRWEMYGTGGMNDDTIRPSKIFAGCAGRRQRLHSCRPPEGVAVLTSWASAGVAEQ